MARIPTTQPGTTQLANPKISTQSPEAMQPSPMGVGKSLQAVGGAVMDVALAYREKLQAAKTYADNATAKNYMIEQMAEARLTESNRTDNGLPPTNDDYSAVEEDLRKREEGLKGLFNYEEDYTRFKQAEWGLNKIQVLKDIREQRIKNNSIKNDVESRKTLKILSNNFNGTPDEIKDMEKIGANAVKALTWEEDEAYDEVQKALKAGNQNWFRRIAKVDREKAKKMVIDGAFGFDQKETDTALSTLNHYKNLEDKNEIINKINGRYDLVDAIAKGQEDLFDLSPQAQILMENDVKLAEAINKARKGKSSFYKDANIGFIDTFNKASKATNQDTLSNLAMSSIYRNTNLPPDKLAAILYYARKRASNLNLTETIISPIEEQTTEAEIAQKQIDAGVNAISRWARGSGATPDIHAQALAEFMQATEKEQPALEAVNKITREGNLRLFPEMANYPEEGQLLIDHMGNQKVGYPTGELKPVELKYKVKPQKQAKPKQEKETDENELPTFEDLKGK